MHTERVIETMHSWTLLSDTTVTVIMFYWITRRVNRLAKLSDTQYKVLAYPRTCLSLCSVLLYMCCRLHRLVQDTKTFPK